MSRQPPYDFLIVGSGIFGATFARVAADAGKKCLVIDRRTHIGGNCFTEKVEGIDVHRYGPHIFHTNDHATWEFVNRFASFNNYTHTVNAISRGKAYSLPFNLHTFSAMWGTTTPEAARTKLESQRLKISREPANLEEQALMLVGTDIYETLIRDYTKKQWQRAPAQLPASIIRRLPVRLTWDNRYFDDRYQGIPEGGYTSLIEGMLRDVETRLGVEYLTHRSELEGMAKHVVYTGQIDAFFDYEFGELDYRTLAFENEVLETDNFQGAAVINYTSLDEPFTRIIEHRHFARTTSPVTYVTREIPDAWARGKIPYYPINDAKNNALFQRYLGRAKSLAHVSFGGRLGRYQYFDMHQVVADARTAATDLVHSHTLAGRTI